jgi:hypothetical protein
MFTKKLKIVSSFVVTWRSTVHRKESHLPAPLAGAVGPSLLVLRAMISAWLARSNNFAFF